MNKINKYGAAVLCLIMMLALVLSTLPVSATTSTAPVRVELKSDHMKYVTRSFNYGRTIYRDKKAQVKMPYYINGTVTIPVKKGKYPVVVFIHGNHDNNNEKRRLDTGFTYAAQKLAQNGYAAVTLNIQPAYVWKYGDSDFVIKASSMYPKFIAALKAVNKTGRLETGGRVCRSFRGKLDLKKIMLVGHSNGGEIAVNLSKKQVKGSRVVAVVGLANTEPTFHGKMRDIDQAYIVAGSDGDVSTMDASITGHLAAKYTKDRKKPIFIGTAEHLNHNYFNTTLKKNDASRIDRQLAGKKAQRGFLSSFLVDYSRYVFKGRVNALFSSVSTEPASMYGIRVKTEVLAPSARSIYRGGTVSGITTSGPVEAEKHRVGSSALTGEELSYAFPLSGDKVYNHLDITQLTYTGTGAAAIIPVKERSLRNAENITLVMAQDSSSPLNNKTAQAFTLKLHMSSGAVITVAVGAERPALGFVKGELSSYEGEKVHTYSSTLPLSMIRIPVAALGKAARSGKLTAVEMVFDRRASGTLLLERIEMQ
jgi:dienelactone hydrolase